MNRIRSPFGDFGTVYFARRPGHGEIKIGATGCASHYRIGSLGAGA